MIDVVQWLCSLLWGDSEFTLAVTIVVGRYVVSVTGITAGLRYGEIVFDDVTNPGMTHGVQCGITMVSTAGEVREGLAISSAGWIWSLGDDVSSPDHTDGPTFSAGEVAMFSVNASNGKCWLGKVGTGWYGGGDPAADTSETKTLPTGLFHLGAAIERASNPPIGGAQFSLRTQTSQFTGSIPSGFSAWYT